MFNNQPKSEPGQHWLAIYGVAAPSKGGAVGAAAAAASNSGGGGGGGGLHIEIEFFDSYALPPAAYSLHSQFRSIVHFLKVTLQSPSSALCGHYCLYFLFAGSHGYSFPDIISRILNFSSSSSSSASHPHTPD